MLVREWMTPDPITIGPEDTLLKASLLMKENDIGCLPVVDEGGLLTGIISDSDLREANQQRHMTPTRWDSTQDLSPKVREIMSRRVITVDPMVTLEKAAVVMLEENISSLPVMDGLALIGILTRGDVFRLLTTITGIYRGSIRYSFILDDHKPEQIRQLIDVMREHGARLVSLLTAYSGDRDAVKKIYIRIADPPPDNLLALNEVLRKNFSLEDIIQDEIP